MDATRTEASRPPDYFAVAAGQGFTHYVAFTTMMMARAASTLYIFLAIVLGGASRGEYSLSIFRRRARIWHTRHVAAPALLISSICRSQQTYYENFRRRRRVIAQSAARAASQLISFASYSRLDSYENAYATLPRAAVLEWRLRGAIFILVAGDATHIINGGRSGRQQFEPTGARRREVKGTFSLPRRRIDRQDSL